MPTKYDYTLSDVNIPIVNLNAEINNGIFYLTEPLSKSYTEGDLHIHGAITKDEHYRIDVPLPDLPGEICAPEFFEGRVKACFRAMPKPGSDRTFTVEGRIRTKNFPSGDWSNATWISLFEFTL